MSVLLSEGLPVPDGFVVPFDDRAPLEGRAHHALRDALRHAVACELGRMGDPVVAVRSSAVNEDTEGASAAGQYESILGVRGAADVCEAITACQASARSSRVTDYWNRSAGNTGDSRLDMAVLVQRLIAADVSGVMFTPAQEGGSTRVEASWGLGLVVVSGTVAPDRYEVAPDGTVRVTIGRKEARIDLNQDVAGLTNSPVSEQTRTARALSDEDAGSLAELGSRIAALLGGPQDVEWAIANGEIWILQARPITASLPPSSSFEPITPGTMLTGTPGSHGVVTAQARIVRGLSDFGHVHPGEILVCPYTDPAWTPLFTIAAGVIAETGGALSHAAIVAREYGIPAVLGVAGAMQRIHDGDRITLDGAAGTVTPA
ncbi:hypothetical protein GCM10027416_01120 [Okibacterium endophyticum]